MWVGTNFFLSLFEGGVLREKGRKEKKKLENLDTGDRHVKTRLAVADSKSVLKGSTV